MRVHNPGPGEIHDRIIVLMLKIQYGKPEQKLHFVKERVELHDLLSESKLRLKGPCDVGKPIRELMEIHERIWALIDLMHVEQPDDRMAEFARESVRLNDRRAALVGEINAAFGIENRPEKV
jgi:hypothetical protein